MKNALMAALCLLLFSSCSDKLVTNNYDETEYVTVTLAAKTIISSSEQPFMARARAATEHPIPTDFTAYLVANESKGEYVKEDVVETLDVSSGMNEITIPKMSYTVYITNYEKDGLWYTWPEPIEQLPQTSETLYLFGKNTIDYSESNEGEVEVHNPYAAVMIAKNKWVNGTPKAYNTGQDYLLTSDKKWYSLYLRTKNTNTEIPINIPSYPSPIYVLDRDIEPNKVYRFTVNGQVLKDGGNLDIIAESFQEGADEEIRF